MDPARRERVGAAQARVDRALAEPVEEAGRSSFSEYVPAGSTELQTKLLAAGSRGEPLQDIEAILDEFERLLPSADRARLRHALNVVLTHHPAMATLGLRLPSLEERSPWKTWPSRRE